MARPMATESEHARVVSMHNTPQDSPQEYDCGCVTHVFVTDRRYLCGERPFEMRLVHTCSKDECDVRMIRQSRKDCAHGLCGTFGPTHCIHWFIEDRFGNARSEALDTYDDAEYLLTLEPSC